MTTDRGHQAGNVGIGATPGYLKPSIHLVTLALIGLDAPPWTSILVGDSVSDIEAAGSAQLPSIGYANKAGKDRAFVEAGANAVISSMAELADALRQAPYDPDAAVG